MSSSVSRGSVTTRRWTPLANCSRFTLLVGDFFRDDETGTTHEHLTRDHRAMDCNRKTALQEAHRGARTNELRYPPVRQVRKDQCSLGYACFDQSLLALLFRSHYPPSQRVGRTVLRRLDDQVL